MINWSNKEADPIADIEEGIKRIRKSKGFALKTWRCKHCGFTETVDPARRKIHYCQKLDKHMWIDESEGTYEANNISPKT